MFADRHYASEDDCQMRGTGEMYAISEELRRNSIFPKIGSDRGEAHECCKERGPRMSPDQKIDRVIFSGFER